MSEVVGSDSRRVVVGVHGSVTSLAALRTGLEQARARDAILVPVLAWSPVGGELTYRKAPCPQLLDQGQVARQVPTLEPRLVRPHFAAGQRAVGRPGAAEQPAGQHAVRGDADAQLPAGGQDLVLDPAGDQ